MTRVEKAMLLLEQLPDPIVEKFENELHGAVLAMDAIRSVKATADLAGSIAAEALKST